MAYLADMPADLKAAIRRRCSKCRPRTRPPSTRSTKASRGRSAAVDHKAYEPWSSSIKFVDSLRKKKTLVTGPRQARAAASRPSRCCLPVGTSRPSDQCGHSDRPLPELARTAAAAYRRAVAAKRRAHVRGCSSWPRWSRSPAGSARSTVASSAANFCALSELFLNTFRRSVGDARADVAEWFWGLKLVRPPRRTLLIAYLGTLLGAAGGFLLCFPPSANLSRAAGSAASAPLPGVLPHRAGDRLRAIFVVAFGLGPLPGVLAIAIHTRARWASCSPRWSRTST